MNSPSRFGRSFNSNDSSSSTTWAETSRSRTSSGEFFGVATVGDGTTKLSLFYIPRASGLFHNSSSRFETAPSERRASIRFGALLSGKPCKPTNRRDQKENEHGTFGNAARLRV